MGVPALIGLIQICPIADNGENAPATIKLVATKKERQSCVTAFRARASPPSRCGIEADRPAKGRGRRMASSSQKGRDVRGEVGFVFMALSILRSWSEHERTETGQNEFAKEWRKETHRLEASRQRSRIEEKTRRRMLRKDRPGWPKNWCGGRTRPDTVETHRSMDRPRRSTLPMSDGIRSSRRVSQIVLPRCRTFANLSGDFGT